MTGFSACLFAVLTAFPQIPSEPAGVLSLDGVQFGASVTLNGCPVAVFTSSYNAHVFDVSKAVRRICENTLIVRTNGHPRDASFDTNDDWTLHGIHRTVRVGERLGGSFDLMPQTADNERTLDAVFGAVPSQDIFHPFTKSYDE